MKVIDTLHKLEQSPFYRLGTKSRLASILLIDKKSILLSAKKQPYRSFQKEVKNKVRDIDVPKGDLRLIQNRIQDLLRRIETPTWLFSGKKGLSYIDNAKSHVDASNVITCDIKSFYPNCTTERVFQIFKYTFKTTDDIAWILSNLVTIEGRLPQGSPTSQVIAFWAYYPTFCDINDMAEKFGAKISLYVDDITISSDKEIPLKLVTQIKKRLELVGHTLKDSKTRIYGKKSFKLITGVAINPSGELKIPNKRRQKILKAFASGTAGTNSIEGQVNSARMIEKSFMQDLEISSKEED